MFTGATPGHAGAAMVHAQADTAAFAPVRPRLDEAVLAGTPAAIAHEVKAALDEVLGRGGPWCVEGVVGGAGRRRGLPPPRRTLSYHE